MGATKMARPLAQSYNAETGETTIREFTDVEFAAWDAQTTAYAAGANDRAAKSVRTERDSKLALTDFYALSDTVMSEAMTTYRQALRDIPAQAGFPNSITWPESP
tara:strand:+ start:393 stop:707 length:315 start_codon:yes stop_codon:yes gene_type:complete